MQGCVGELNVTPTTSKCRGAPRPWEQRRLKRKKFVWCGPQCGQRADRMRWCQSVGQFCTKDNHLMNWFYSIRGKRVDGRVYVQLANDHLMALRLNEFEIVIFGPVCHVFKFSRYSVRVWGWQDQVEIICEFAEFAYFIRNIKRNIKWVQIRCIIHKQDGAQSLSLNNTTGFDAK